MPENSPWLPFERASSAERGFWSTWLLQRGVAPAADVRAVAADQATSGISSTGPTEPRTPPSPLIRLPGTWGLVPEIPDAPDPLGRGPKALVWAPCGWPEQPVFCIASSRMGRSPEQTEGWIEALRTSCLSAARDRALVMVVENSSTGPWVQRMAQWVGLGTVTLRRAPHKPNEAWWSAAARRAGSQDFPVWIFEPPEDLSHGAAGTQKAGRQRESLDHWAISFSDQVRVLRVTDGGNVFHAIESRLQRSLSPGSLWLLIGPSAVPDHLRLRWLALGAIDWCLAPSEPDHGPASAAATRSANDAGQAGGPILETLPEDIDDFLSHWTRTPSAPGSSEPGFQHLDRVLWGDQGSLQGPASALLSIVATGRIHASGRMTRESHPVVCFTAVPLPDFRRRRVFRPHLCRWDFEAFGIAVRKSRLERLGARPVIYGDDQTWQSLSADDRIRFQASRTPLNPDATDWSDEREWRLAGDLNLSLFGPSDCLVFVGDGESARAIAPYSRWPVVILPPSG